MDENEYLRLTKDQLDDLVEQFNSIDSNGNGFLEDYELQHALNVVGFKKAHYEIRDLMQKFDVKVQDNRIDFEEFKQLYAELRKQDFGFKTLNVVKAPSGIENYGASSTHANEDMKHSIQLQEQLAFSNWINRNLSSDDHCKRHLPLHPQGRDLADKCKDGILVCKIINRVKPGTVDERAMNLGEQLSVFQKFENLQLAVNSARSIGCYVVNIGPSDIEKGILHLLLGLLWQIIKIGLLGEVNLSEHRELLTMFGGDESVEELCQSSPEDILIRWVNFHLKKSGCGIQITNFGEHIKDSEAYAYLLEQIAPNSKRQQLVSSEVIVQESCLSKRASYIVSNAEILDASMFVSAADIVSGNHNLNLAFVANLFKVSSTHQPHNSPSQGDTNGHHDVTESEEEEHREIITPFEETREEKTYRNWMNSMGVNPFVYHLYYDLRSGLVLFQLFDIIRPGCVDKTRINYKFKKMSAEMLKLENCNYVVQLGRESGFSLVGVGGEDLLRGMMTPTLALVWQLMRAYTLAIIQTLTHADKPVTEKDILAWANEKLATEPGKPPAISGFNDVTLGDGHLILRLIDSIRPGVVSQEMVKPGRTKLDRFANANYAVNIARKIGANIYALPEDITEVKPKMIMTIFACLMVVDAQKSNGN